MNKQIEALKSPIVNLFEEEFFLDLFLFLEEEEEETNPPQEHKAFELPPVVIDPKYKRACNKPKTMEVRKEIRKWCEYDSFVQGLLTWEEATTVPVPGGRPTSKRRVCKNIYSVA